MRKKEFPDSKSVRIMEYDPSSQVLTITFASGKRYNYKEVPESVYDEAIVADSVGSYVHKNIARTYEYEEIFE
jgi:hypothetical protein